MGKPPLFWALQALNLACAELLLQHGADVTILNYAGQDTLFYAAWFYDSTEIIKMLLAVRGDMNRATRVITAGEYALVGAV